MMKSLITVAGIALTAGTAQAADAVATIAPEPIAEISAPAFSWSGPYLGVQGGWAWLDGEFSDGTDTITGDLDGGTFGGFVGYNWQFGNGFVAGVEGDLDYNWNEESIAGTDTRTTWAGSVRGRVGYALDRALIYAAGGWTATKFEAEDGGDEIDDTFHGWTLGAGVDYAVTDNVFLRGEYRYNDFGDESFDVGPGTLDVDLDQHVVKVGLGVKF